MATVSETESDPLAVGSWADGVDKDSKSEQFLAKRLAEAGADVKGAALTTFVMASGVASMLWLACGVVCEHWLLQGGMPAWARWGWLACWLAALLAAAVRWVLPLIAYRVNLVYAAREIEKEHPDLHNDLVNAVLVRARPDEKSPLVVKSLRRRAAKRLSTVPADGVVDRGPAIRLAAALAALIAAACVYELAAPKSLVVTAARLVAPWLAIAAPSRVRIDGPRLAWRQPGGGAEHELPVVQRAATLIRGRQLVVAGGIRGLRGDERPEIVVTPVSDERAPTAASAGWRAELTSSSAAGSRDEFATTVPGPDRGLDQSIDLVLAAGDARSEPIRVNVVDAPSLLVRELQYHYPKYTGLEDETVEWQGDITGPEGTTVTIVAQSNQPLAEAWLDLECDGQRDGSFSVGRLDLARYTRELTLRLKPDRRTPEHGSYRLMFRPRSVAGASRESDVIEPLEHRILVTPDLAPEVVIESPAEKLLRVPPTAPVTVVVRAIDPDFGIASVRLETRVEGGQARKGPELVVGDRQKTFRRSVDIVPEQLGATAGTRLEYRAIAADERAGQPNTVESPWQVLQIDPAASPPPSPPKPGRGAAGAGTDAGRPPDADGAGDRSADAGSGDGDRDSQRQRPDDERRPGDRAAEEQATQAAEPERPPQRGGEQSGERREAQRQPSRRQDEPRGDPSQGDPREGKQQGGGDGGKPQDGNEGKSGNQSGSRQQDGSSDGAGSEPRGESGLGGDGGRQQGPRPDAGQAAAKPGGAGELDGGSGEAAGREARSGRSDEHAGTKSADRSRGQQRPDGSERSPDERRRLSPDGTDDGEAIERILEDQRTSRGGGDQGQAGGKPEPDRAETSSAEPRGQDERGGPQRGADGQRPQSDDEQRAGDTERSAKQSEQSDGKTSCRAADGKPCGKSGCPTCRGGAQAGGGGSDAAGSATDSPDGSGQEPGKQADAGSPQGGEQRGQKSDAREEKDGQRQGRNDGGREGTDPGPRGEGRQGTGRQGSGPSDQDPASQDPANQDPASQDQPAGDDQQGRGEGQGQGQSGGNAGRSPAASSDPGGDSAAVGDRQGVARDSRPGGGAEAARQGEGGSEAASTGSPGGPAASSDQAGRDAGGNAMGGSEAGQTAGEPSADLHPREMERDDPDFAHARNAVDLALEHLRDSLDNGRGELLDKLGWTEDQARRWLEHWEKLRERAQSGDSRERGKFESALRSLGLRGDGARRSRDVPADAKGGQAEGRRSRPPSEYREQFKAFLQGVSVE